ncbi:hypothetical protein CWI37_0690p0010 [Hamiltosporidium tvaerminnensis]|uniref:Uncharacterized protein n=1 Tax=Hamiltosporidium tvaerminnensis TaxID=1176355 RepID=A0A4Q9L2A9_9MICR|nr:hypothetical protein CWI37_0690p0010 [Hamiltosporidium tvaerminnensis]
MTERSVLERVYIFNQDGRRILVCHKTRWLDGIKEDLSNLGIDEWEKEALDRVTTFSKKVRELDPKKCLCLTTPNEIKSISESRYIFI